MGILLIAVSPKAVHANRSGWIRGTPCPLDGAQRATREIPRKSQLAAPGTCLHGTQSGHDRGSANNLAAPYGGRRESAGTP